MPPALPKDLVLRTGQPADHPRIIDALTAWWGGRDLSTMLPKLFLIHFQDTSFVIEKNHELIAFLVGFFSQSSLDEAYIHFVGVHPRFRHQGIGRLLYDRFFHLCREHGRHSIRACTSPVNTGSIAFHQKMGFALLPGDAESDGIPITLHYNKPNDSKVLFKKSL